MKKRQQKSPRENSKGQDKFTLIRIHQIFEPVKFVYTDFDIVEEAKKHPEKINGIIADAKSGNCSNRLLEKLYSIQADYFGWEY